MVPFWLFTKQSMPKLHDMMYMPNYRYSIWRFLWCCGQHHFTSRSLVSRSEYASGFHLFSCCVYPASFFPTPSVTWLVHIQNYRFFFVIISPFAGLNFGWNWLKNTVPAELLWEKNTVPAEKTSRTSRTLRQANEAIVGVSYDWQCHL